MARYLRFAAAGFFALLTLALIGLWVRSHYRLDMIHSPIVGSKSFSWASNCGAAIWSVYNRPSAIDGPTRWTFYSERSDPIVRPQGETGVLSGLGFAFARSGRWTAIALPHWFLAASSLGLAALFAFKRNWRFTIRTLLVATTLVAAGLGIGVYLS
jgi:hypothetical protein